MTPPDDLNAQLAAAPANVNADQLRENLLATIDCMSIKAAALLGIQLARAELMKAIGPDIAPSAKAMLEGQLVDLDRQHLIVTAWEPCRESIAGARARAVRR